MSSNRSAPSLLSLCTLVLLSLLPVGCGGSSSPTSPTTSTATVVTLTYNVTDFVSAVSSLTGTAGVQIASAPTTSGGTGFTPTTSANVINGGSRVVRLQSTSPFSTVYITVGGVDRTVSGYWLLTLSAATTDTYIVITMSRTMPKTTFNTNISLATGSGSMTTPVEVATTVLAASTGDVQVSVTWNTPSDVDLQVVEPSGERVYWGRKTSATGGTLDLDSNAGCTIDNKNNENIRWTSAPAGSYTVAVDYYKACTATLTQYVVTVNNGGTQAIYTGTFTGSGDLNVTPRTVTTFTRGGPLMTMEESLRAVLPQLGPTTPKPLWR